MRTVPPSEIVSLSLNVLSTLTGSKLRSGRVAETEVQLAAGLEQLLVRFRDDDPCAGHAFQLRQARDVIEVALRSGQDFRVGELEPELFHAGLDLLAVSPTPVLIRMCPCGVVIR